MTDPSSAAETGAATTFEFAVPAGWPPALAVTFAEMMDKAIDDGFPVVVPVRKDATPEQISQVFADVQALVDRLGLGISHHV